MLPKKVCAGFDDFDANSIMCDKRAHISGRDTEAFSASTELSDVGKVTSLICLLIITAERDGYYGIAEVIFPTFLSNPDQEGD